MKAVYLILLVLFLALPITYGAESLGVEKFIGEDHVNVGGAATVLLKFKNPFGKELPISIKDNNVLGANGLEIKCLEYTLPPDPVTSIAYEPITPYGTGAFTLESAEVTYKNPETGKEETVVSNTLDIEVEGQGQGSAQGITSIYECGGMSMRSTSFSSGSSFSLQFGQGGMAPPSTPSQSPQDRLQNSQLNQDAEQLKQELEQRRAEHAQMEKEFRESLAGSQDFQEVDSTLKGRGYNMSSSEFDMESNNTGSFNMTYQKPTGETATVQGKMKDGELDELSYFTHEEREAIMDALEKDQKFQELDSELRSQGFLPSEPIFNQIRQNMSGVSVPYSNQEGETRNITAVWEDGKIKNVDLEEETDSSWWRPWLLVLTLLLAALWYFYRRSRQDDMTMEETTYTKIPQDTGNEYLLALEEALMLFEEGRKKDACEKASQTLRSYFAWRLGLKCEPTSQEIMNALEGRPEKEKVRECLEVCALVEFARKKIDREEFEDIYEETSGLVA